MSAERGLRMVGWIVALAVLCGDADATERKRRANRRDRDPAQRQDDELATNAETFKEMIRQTQEMGPWEAQAQTNAQAADLFFERQGWTSESDQWARGIMGEVDRIPPWQQHERMDVFLGSLQQRYGLSETQKSSFGQDLERQSMQIAMRHFKEMAPVAMEAMKTRASGEPFTPEQVARWTKAMRPVMEEARQMFDRLASDLGETMTPEQRKLMQADIDAFMKRHRDVEKLAARWERGEWDPTQWGLDNDPVHAAQVAAVRAKQPAVGSAVPDRGMSPPAAPAKPEDESAWQRYVREYCAAHRFDDAQIKAAWGILSEKSAEAKNFRAARAQEIRTIEQALAAEDGADRKAELTAELKRTLAPIAEMFEDMCRRLDDLLTAEQRQRFAKPVTDGAAAAKSGEATSAK